jgi:glycosyltransferase involved in cell wall biosynthesis
MSQVSCIIPFYNGQETINRAIRSVLTQAECLEIIIVNDASPSPLTLEPDLQVHLTTGQIKIIELNTNHGQAAARNIGASIATGRYLSFLDQDDLFLTGFYLLATDFLGEHPHISAFEAGAEIVQNDQVILDSPDPRYDAAIASVPWNIVIRRHIFWAAGAFPISNIFRTDLAGEDAVFKKTLAYHFIIATIANKFIRHNVRENSATDRYLKRTEIINNEIVFKENHELEKSGLWDKAFIEHMDRTKIALDDLKSALKNQN